MVQFGEENAQRRPYIFPEVLERRLWQGEGLSLLPDDSDQMRGNGLELCQWRFRMERFLLRKSGDAQGAWGGGGVTTSGGV